VTFRLVTGPGASAPPKGLPLFKAVTYMVQCTERQYRRGLAHANDHSDLVIEGYVRPQADEQGQLYVAVVATSVSSQRQQAGRKLEQLREAFTQAEAAYEEACAEHGEESPQAAAALTQWEAMKSSLLKFLEHHPEFQGQVF
jgi:hypothetical protein